MYTCPGCGAGLKYDIVSKKMICEFCGTTKEISDFEEINGSKQEQYFDATRFTCTQCGAELVSADNTGATFCSFCGSSTLLESRLSKEKKPDFIIPFSKTKKDCADAYAKMMKKAWFAPKELKDAKYIDGFRGIYMPYWVYGVKHSGDFSLKGETFQRIGDYDITRYYNLSGTIDANYFGMSHDASYEFSDDISEALAPYNTKSVEDFHGSYLSGFYADISDVPNSLYKDEPLNFANNCSLSTIKGEPEFRKYTISIPNANNSIPFRVEEEEPKYALFPVWFMSYRNNDRIAYVTINGQTGKIAADIPVDIKQYLSYSLLLAIPVFIIINGISFTQATDLLFLTLLLSVFAMICSIIGVSKIIRKDLGLDDKGLQSQNKNNQKRPSILGTMANRLFKKKELIGIFMTFLSFIISLSVAIINPVSDIYYYGAAIFAIVATSLGFIDVIKDHNVLATRKLPQFNREGGNDDANIYE